jgi:hypothetical protein
VGETSPEIVGRLVVSANNVAVSRDQTAPCHGRHTPSRRQARYVRTNARTPPGSKKEFRRWRRGEPYESALARRPLVVAGEADGERVLTPNTRRSFVSAGCLTPKLDPRLGLHFRNVLGDALCDEWRFARRLPRVA